MSDDYKKYLQPETVSKLKTIELKAKLIVEGFITGLHKSPYHGFSVEFAEHRQYAAGDELRHLDWRVFARTDKYYVKQYEEETNLRSYILLDTSSSMCYSSGEKVLPKIEYAAYLSAALSVMMLQQRDGIGLVTYGDELQKFIPPRLTPSHQNLILQTLHKASQLVSGTKGLRTNSAKSLSQIAERIQKRGLIIVMSDFLDEPEKIISALKHFRHRRHEVIVFHIVDPKERSFEFDGDAEIVDVETGETMMTSPQQIKSAYRAAFDAFTRRYRSELTESNIDYNLLDTSQPFGDALLAYLKKRNAVK
ncbi:MAG: DUF58 domain-containing protein [Rhizobacter sp.]|nr:DUF58 domain-containing protein [Chlorobiales bacterium]